MLLILKVQLLVLLGFLLLFKLPPVLLLLEILRLLLLLQLFRLSLLLLLFICRFRSLLVGDILMGAVLQLVSSPFTEAIEGLRGYLLHGYLFLHCLLTCWWLRLGASFFPGHNFERWPVAQYNEQWGRWPSTTPKMSRPPQVSTLQTSTNFFRAIFTGGKYPFCPLQRRRPPLAGVCEEDPQMFFSDLHGHTVKRNLGFPSVCIFSLKPHQFASKDISSQ